MELVSNVVDVKFMCFINISQREMAFQAAYPASERFEEVCRRTGLTGIKIYSKGLRLF